MHEMLVDQGAHLAEHALLELVEQVVHVAIVEVERRAVVARAVRYLADGDLLDGLLQVKGPERLREIRARLLGYLRLLGSHLITFP